MSPARNGLRTWTLALAACLALAALVAAATSASAATEAGAAKTCSTPRYPGDGYFTSLTVSGVSCATGRDFIRAYYRCRLRHGKAGRCQSPFRGYSCREKRNSIATEIDARVTCTRGSKRIVHTYQQNT